MRGLPGAAGARGRAPRRRSSSSWSSATGPEPSGGGRGASAGAAVPARRGRVRHRRSVTAPSSRCAPSAQPRDGEYAHRDLHDGPAHDRRTDGARPARAARDRFRTRTFARLLSAVFAEGSPPGPATATRPAGKHYHHAYRHGLLEHSLTVAQAVSAISATFPGIDRDVAVTGALLHDIGKLDAYELDGGAIVDVRRRPAAGRDPARLLPGAPHDRAARRASRWSSPRRCCTSSSATTARSSTAARWSRARARRRSCT